MYKYVLFFAAAFCLVHGSLAEKLGPRKSRQASGNGECRWPGMICQSTNDCCGPFVCNPWAGRCTKPRIGIKRSVVDDSESASSSSESASSSSELSSEEKPCVPPISMCPENKDCCKTVKITGDAGMVNSDSGQGLSQSQG